jgi:hypothetical protein
MNVASYVLDLLLFSSVFFLHKGREMGIRISDFYFMRCGSQSIELPLEDDIVF